MKNEQVFSCPSQSKNAGSAAPNPVKTVYVGYTYNQLLSWRAMAGVASPSSIFLMTEGFGDQAYLNAGSPGVPSITSGFGPGQPYVFGGSTQCSMTSAFSNGPGAFNFQRIHGGMNNYLYADGHVKALSPVGDFRTHPFSKLNPDGSLAGYRSSDGNQCPSLWIPE